MPPAFSSVRQAAGFALLVLLLLLSPILAGKSLLPPRKEIYASIPWARGAYPYIRDQIFDESGDIDIALLGSSHMGHGVDGAYLQAQLSKALGRPAKVVTLCWGWSGFDTLYFISSDLLQHRKVHMLVFYDDQGPDAPHEDAWRFVRYGDNWGALRDLPFVYRLQYYYGAILGMPRNLIDLLRPNLGVHPLPNGKRFIFQPLPEWMGVAGSRTVSAPDPLTVPESVVSARAQEVVTYSSATAAKFSFDQGKRETLQDDFGAKLVRLAQEHGTRLVCLNIPIYDNRRNSLIPEGAVWSDTMRNSAPLIGVAPAGFFEGMDDATVRGLYSDTVHLNEKGRAYFTRVITPELVQVYEQSHP